jgi:hypothetical protein
MSQIDCTSNNPFRSLWYAWVLVLATACVTGRSSVVPGASRPIDSTYVPRDSLGVTRFTTSIYDPGELHYQYRLTSVVRSIVGDSTTRVDSTQITAAILAVFAKRREQDSTDVRIQADSVFTTLPNSATTKASASQLRLFTVDNKTGYVRATMQVEDSCSDKTVSMPSYGAELVPTISFASVTTWSDSSQVRTCQGGITLTFTQKAFYRIAESVQSPSSIRLIRLTEAVVTGHGYQWNQQVEVSGHGSSVDTLFLTKTPSRLQRLTGNAILEIGFRSALRNQQFIQTTVTQAVLAH